MLYLAERPSWYLFLEMRNSVMTYLVYENRIGFPMRLNSVFEFDDLRRAVYFAREKAKSYETQGLIVERFNGHDWVWFAVDLKDGSDKGILIQIFLKESVTGTVIVPNEEYSAT